MEVQYLYDFFKGDSPTFCVTLTKAKIIEIFFLIKNINI